MVNEPLPAEQLEQVIDRFWETVPPLWNQVRAHIRAVAAAEFGLTVEQFHILRHIRRGVTSVSELATAKQISRPAVSQAVDGLVQRGLISRTPNLVDRRCVQLELTPAGNALLAAVFENTHGWMKEQLAGLTPGELAELLGALEALKKVQARWSAEC